uniref:Uncharacterized protein n=1 Tax=Noctiluca scintillans TaxID=2966 RepID=A0A7S1AHD8_NOCSC
MKGPPLQRPLLAAREGVEQPPDIGIVGHQIAFGPNGIVRTPVLVSTSQDARQEGESPVPKVPVVVECVAIPKSGEHDQRDEEAVPKLGEHDQRHEEALPDTFVADVPADVSQNSKMSEVPQQSWERELPPAARSGDRTRDSTSLEPKGGAQNSEPPTRTPDIDPPRMRPPTAGPPASADKVDAQRVGRKSTKVQVTILHATLPPVSDAAKWCLESFVKMFRCFPDGREALVARTASTHVGNNDLNTAWNEDFAFSHVEGSVVRFRIFVAKIRCEILATSKMDLDAILPTLRGAKTLDLPILKAKDRMHLGTMQVRVCLEQDTSEAPLAPRKNPIEGTLSFANVIHLLQRPEELEDKVRKLFRQLARSSGRDNRPVLRSKDMSSLSSLLSEKFKVDAEVFGEVSQMFWRFDISGDGLLYENEAVKLILFMLQQYRDSTDASPPGAIQFGETIRHRQVSDKYDVKKELGRGGQGIVYLANEKDTGQEVVVKMCSKKGSNTTKESTTQEFELLMTLKHPKIARVYEIFQDWANVYIVQEPYFGGDLTTALKKAHDAGVKVNERWLAAVIKQVLSGVEFLHGKNVMHCDLKEPNVMVAGKTNWDAPQVIVIDFGLANHFSSRSRVGGTPGYIPLEVWDHGLWTPRGDVFSLGVMMYSLWFGYCPFVKGCRKVEEVAERTRAFEPTIPHGSRQFQELVSKMMAKPLLKRPVVAQIMQSEWFGADAGGQDLHMNTIAVIVGRQKQTDLHRALLADLGARSNLAHLQKMNDMFIELDHENKGCVSADGVRKAFNNQMSSSEIEQLITCLVGDANGQLSYEEFMGQLIAAKEPEENALLMRIFNEVDTDNVGYLTREQVQVLIKRPNVARVLRDKPEQLVDMMDRDGDKRITFEEFKCVVQGKRVGHSYQKGQKIFFWSSSYNQWCPGTVLDVRDKAVQVDCKPGYWLQGSELRKVRPAHK